MKFQWQEKLCFDVSSGSKVLTKLMIVLISILKRLNIVLIMYLDNVNDTCKGYINFSIAESRILVKYQRICCWTLWENIISRNDCWLEANDPVTFPRESNSNYRAMLNFSLKRPGFSERNLSTNQEIVLLSIWSPSSRNLLKVSSKTTDFRVFCSPKLRNQSVSIFRSQERATLGGSTTWTWAMKRP